MPINIHVLDFHCLLVRISKHALLSYKFFLQRVVQTSSDDTESSIEAPSRRKPPFKVYLVHISPKLDLDLTLEDLHEFKLFLVQFKVKDNLKLKLE